MKAANRQPWSIGSSSPKGRASNGDGISKNVRAAGDKVGSIGSTVESIADKTRHGAGRALIASRRRRRVLGVSLPRRRTNMQRVATQFSSMAAELEKKSLHVRRAAGSSRRARSSPRNPGTGGGEL